jgi:hypothetical protein
MKIIFTFIHMALNYGVQLREDLLLLSNKLRNMSLGFCSVVFLPVLKVSDKQ